MKTLYFGWLIPASGDNQVFVETEETNFHHYT